MAIKKEIELGLKYSVDAKGIEEARKQIESLKNADKPSSGKNTTTEEQTKALEKEVQAEERRQKKAQEAADAIEQSRRREKASLNELVSELEKYQAILEKATQQENHPDRLKALKNIEDLEKRISALTRAQEREAQAAEKAARAEAQAAEKSRALNQSTQQLDKGSQQTTRSVKRMGQGLLQVAYFMDDVQYGIKGILNNIPGLVIGFGGGAGLAGAMSLAVLAGAKLYEWMGNTEAKSKELAKAIEEEAEAFRKLKAEVEETWRQNQNEQILREALDSAKKIADYRKLESEALKYSLDYRKELISLESGIKDDEAEIARLKVEEDFANGLLGEGSDAERRKARLLEGIELDSRARRRGEIEESASLDVSDAVNKRIDAARRQREAKAALQNASINDDIMTLEERRAAEVSVEEQTNSLRNDLYDYLISLRDKEVNLGAIRYKQVSDKNIYDAVSQFVGGKNISDRRISSLLDKYGYINAEDRRDKIFNTEEAIEKSDIALEDSGFSLGNGTSGEGGYSNAYASYAKTIETLEKEYEEAEKSLIEAINEEEKATRNFSNIKKKNESEAAVDEQRGRTAQAQERKSIREERQREDAENEIKGRKKDIDKKTEELKKNNEYFSEAVDRFIVEAGKSATDQQKALVRAASEAIRGQVKKAASDGVIDSREYEQIGIAFRDALRQQGITNQSILNGLSGNMKEALLLINIQSGELKNLKNGLDQMKKDLEQAKNNIEGLRRRKH